MSNRPDNDAKLLAEAFHDDWVAGRTADFARAAAAHARARRRARRTFAAVGAAAAVGLLVFSASSRVAPAPEVAGPLSSHRLAATATTTPSARGYEVISDEELLAHLREQPVFVFKKEDGTREIVLLANE